MLYTALSPDQPPQSDLLHPPQQMVLALDMSYLLAFSHLTPTDQTVIFPMKFLRAFAHFTLTFIPIFLVHLFHSVTVLLFSFSYASEPTSQVELSSLYVSNFLLAHHFLQFWVGNNFTFHPEGTMISLLRFFVHNCFIHASAGAWQGRLGPFLILDLIFFYFILFLFLLFLIIIFFSLFLIIIMF